MITRQPIDSLTDNILERLKVSSIERFFDNLEYVINPWNANVYYLAVHYDQRLINRRSMDRIHDYSVKRLKKVQSLMYIQNECKKNKMLVKCIYQLTIRTVHVIMESSKWITYILADIFV